MAIDTNEKNSIEYLFSHLSDSPVIIDIGSNKGDWAEIFNSSELKNYSIYCFEPNKMLLDYTRIRFAYNKNIYYEELAASNVDGKEVDFFYFTNENNELSSLYYNHYWSDMPMQKGKVKTIKIDTYCKNKGIETVDLLKIDTEGAEMDVLNGVKGMLEKKKVNLVQVEYGGLYKISGITFRDVMKFMDGFGYSCFVWNGNCYAKVLQGSFTEDYRAENYMFSHLSIANMTIGWNREFARNTESLGKFNFVCEIGTAEGLTAKYICENLLVEGGRMICVDPLEDYYTEDDIEHKEIFQNQYNKFISNTKGLPIELVRKPSEIALPEMHQYRFDLIYIDGRHDEEGVYDDAVKSFPITRQEGYILFDDYMWRPETEKGINRFLTEYQNRIEIIEKGYQVLIKKITE